MLNQKKRGKMKYLLLLLLLVGCVKEVPVYHNTTIIKEVIVEVIKEIEVPANCDVCPEINTSCEKDLRFCNIQSDVINDELFDCYLNNVTIHMENITYNYNDCMVDLEKCEGKLSNISEVLR